MPAAPIATTRPHSPVSIKRASAVHTEEPYGLTEFAWNTERVLVDDQERSVEYILAILPMDCVDDVTRAHRYNPRHPKGDHRDRLMHQIGTYGLIQPLVATFEKSTSKNGPHTLFLIDGRHRYHALLGLDDALRQDIVKRSQKASQKRELEALSDISKLAPPSDQALESLKTYQPRWDVVKGGVGSPMVPVKIYLGQDEVERIGMAVFLNKGQKKLHGGEEIDRIFDAFELALQEEGETSTPSEAHAVERVMKGRGTTDASLVVLSRHVAAAMRNNESPWYDLIGRWQSESVDEDEETSRKKPLTAKNYMSFVGQVVNGTPYSTIQEDTRLVEVDNLDRLGDAFYKIFDWPNDIPTQQNRFTATSIVCRSFFVSALGKVLNDRHRGDSKYVMSQKRVAHETWNAIAADLEKLHSELEKQAVVREKFEKKKRELRDLKTPKERQPLLAPIDELRGQLWSLDTIVSSLESRMTKIMGVQG